MPVVVIPTCFIELGDMTPDATECGVQGRNAPEIVQELFQRFPALFTRFKDEAGRPRTNWFALYSERLGDWIVESDDVTLDADDRIELINLIGC